MKQIYATAFYFIKTLFKEKILYAMVLATFLLLGFTWLLGEMSFSAHRRVIISFALSFFELSLVLGSLLLAYWTLYRPLKSKEIYLLFSKSLTKVQFLAAAFLASWGMLAVISSLQVFFLKMLLLSLELPGVPFLNVLTPLLLEGGILLSLSFLLYSLSNVVISFVSVSILYFTGHGLDVVTEILKKNPEAYGLTLKLVLFLPHLYYLEQKHSLINGTNSSLGIEAFVYAAMWSLLCLGLTYGLGLAKKKDF